MLHLLRQKEALMRPLAESLLHTAEAVKHCEHCGNLDVTNPCAICTDPRRDQTVLCVVEEVAGFMGD